MFVTVSRGTDKESILELVLKVVFFFSPFTIYCGHLLESTGAEGILASTHNLPVHFAVPFKGSIQRITFLISA